MTMDKQTQDQLWQCAPKAFRDYVKEMYQATQLTGLQIAEDVERADRYAEAMEAIFGSHNLTSDAEPEEMLMCERDTLIWLYSKTDSVKVRLVLEQLFGSKCLPDEKAEEIADKCVEPIKEHFDKAEPKFKRGDKVRISCAYDNGEIWDKIMHGRIAAVKSHYINNGGIMMYKFEEGIRDFAEHWLEPYTESTQTSDNMEEKELNLCEILKGYEGEMFYSPCFGDSKLNSAGLPIYIEAIDDGVSYELSSNGLFSNQGVCSIYPSREAFLKYPLDACAAWMEWAETNKPKLWRAKRQDKYFYLDRRFIVKDSYELESDFDNTNYLNGNYFRTKELAQQAAEAVRICLEQFNTDHE